MIPFNKPPILGTELKYIADAIERGHTAGNGSYTKRAEEAIEEICSSPYALLTTNCTHALELSARLLELKPGDEVIVPAYTFVSTAAAFALSGAIPVFADVTERTLTLDTENVKQLLSSRTRAICTVHYAGIGDQVDSLADLARDHEIPLIEDNAHGFGASYKGKKLGTYGALSTLSFHETKNVSCGEGGAIAINDGFYLSRAEILREKGTDRLNFVRGIVDKYTWVDLGSSWVPSDMLAAFLLGQLENFSVIQAKRMSIWNRYHSELFEWSRLHSVKVPHVPSEAVHPAHMYFLRFQDQATRDRFIEHMRIRGVMTVFHYQALNTSPMGKVFGGFLGQCPIAEKASQTLVRLPLFLGMTTLEIDQVVEATLEFQP